MEDWGFDPRSPLRARRCSVPRFASNRPEEERLTTQDRIHAAKRMGANDGKKRKAPPPGIPGRGAGCASVSRGLGVWRRDGRDCEHQCAPGPVPLVTRLAWSLGVPASLISIRVRRCAPGFWVWRGWALEEAFLEETCVDARSHRIVSGHVKAVSPQGLTDSPVGRGVWCVPGFGPHHRRR